MDYLDQNGQLWNRRMYLIFLQYIKNHESFFVSWLNICCVNMSAILKVCFDVHIFTVSLACVSPEGTPRLVPEESSRYYLRVQHYRELLDSLPMDAYTHGCILHPEITADSHIPAYAAASIRSKATWDAEQFKV